MKSMMVIGLGRFGTHLAIKLAELGNEVMVVDTDEESVDKIAHLVTKAQIGDCKDEDVLRTLGVSNFDICFVCISENFQSSLEITSLLKDLGAPYVISKTDRDIHAKFLLKIGADDVVYPERDMAQRTAVKYSSSLALDYIELTEEYAISEILVPDSWKEKTITELNVRSVYNINVIGFKINSHVTPMINAGYTFSGDEHILIAGSKKDIIRLMEKK
ncbi:potassium channel family protein [Gudongella sp. DL1XJH-153]|uniref:potassium channel family protein n=1 Tax=Gudongella sp. DL1XJH-153 TaxID=3409804 RepID=UPI003BB7E7C7